MTDWASTDTWANWIIAARIMRRSAAKLADVTFAAELEAAAEMAELLARQRIPPRQLDLFGYVPPPKLLRPQQLSAFDHGRRYAAGMGGHGRAIAAHMATLVQREDISKGERRRAIQWCAQLSLKAIWFDHVSRENRGEPSHYLP